MSGFSEIQQEDSGMAECMMMEEQAYHQCIQDAANFVSSGAVTEDQFIADLERVLKGGNYANHS